MGSLTAETFLFEVKLSGKQKMRIFENVAKQSNTDYKGNRGILNNSSQQEV